MVTTARSLRHGGRLRSLRDHPARHHPRRRCAIRDRTDRSTPFDATKLGFDRRHARPGTCDEPRRVPRRLNCTEYTIPCATCSAPIGSRRHSRRRLRLRFDTIGDVLRSPLLFEKASGSAHAGGGRPASTCRRRPASKRRRRRRVARSGTTGTSTAPRPLDRDHRRRAVEYDPRARLPVAAGSENARCRSRRRRADRGALTRRHVGCARHLHRDHLPAAGTYTLRVEFQNDSTSRRTTATCTWTAELYGLPDAPPPSAQIAALRALCTPAVDGVRPAARAARVLRAARLAPAAERRRGALVDLGHHAILSGTFEKGSAWR